MTTQGTTPQRTKPTAGQLPSHYLDTPGSRMMLRAPLGLWRLGLGPLAGRVWMVVTTTGRSTGLPRHTVVYPHVVDGRTYLWCPYGGRSQWYRNLVAGPVATVQSHRGTHVVRAVPLSDEAEAMEVVAALRRFGASWFRAYLASQGLDDTEELRLHWQRLHLRRLEPTNEPGPPPLAADLSWVWLVPASALVLGLLARRRA
jgi:deazaflavin-dependent oxidoreductase (nitroreductase family)